MEGVFWTVLFITAYIWLDLTYGNKQLAKVNFQEMGIKMKPDKCGSQKALKRRILLGKTDVNTCNCGRHFKTKRFVGGIYRGKWETYENCFNCRTKELNETKTT